MKQGPFSKLIMNILVLFGCGSLGAAAFAQEKASDAPTFKMTGDIALLSNYIEHGLTQTNKDPSLQGAFSFNFGPQFRLGLWGSNVNFQGSEHFLLKLNAELKIAISNQTDLRIGYFDNRYFKTDTRNGNTLYLLLNIMSYRVRYESTNNWEGTDTSATYYSFGKSYDINPNWKWENDVGYSMLTSNTYSSYFDLRTAAVYKGSSNIFYHLALTATSNPGQFNGAGDIMPYVGATTSF